MFQNPPKRPSIFEAVSNIEHERYGKEKPKEPVVAPTQTKLDEIFQQCRQMHQEIAESIDQAYRQSGISSSQLRSYVSRPQNFSADDWKKVEEGHKQSQQLLAQLKRNIAFFKPIAPPAEAKASEPTKTVPQPPSTSEPKKKTKIVTRRQWIGM